MNKRVHIVLTALAFLGLVGCGASPSGATETPAPASSAPAEGNGGSSSSAPDDELSSDLNGDWGTSDGSFTVLRIDGHRVELEDGGLCQGSVAKEDGVPTIRLKCDRADAKRTVGHVWGLTHKSMTVDWTDYGADDFRRAESESQAA